MAGIPEPKITSLVTANQLEAFATDLLDFAAKLQLAAKVARTQPNEALAIYNWPSAKTGMKSIRGFVARADESRSATELGSPLEVGQLKARSTGKTSLEAAIEIKARVGKTTGRTKKKLE